MLYRLGFLLCVWGSCLLMPLTAASHLCILSGQSNMERLNPSLSFTPYLTKALAKDELVVVKDAQGGKPIRQWYKQWQPVDKSVGTLYDRLLASIKKQTAGKKFDTVTFVWMQGERDAKEQLADKYAEALKGLVLQLEADLEIKNMNVVIGRLSDFDMKNEKYKHWTQIRSIQESLTAAHKRWVLVDTDPYNGDENGLHHTKDGYVQLGEAFAKAAESLIKASK